MPAHKLGRLAILAFATSFQLVAASAVIAHGTQITATAVCVSGTPVINFTSSSWSDGPEGEHSKIDIYLNGVYMGSGAYAQPTNAFSGSLQAPLGTSAALSALADGPWEDGSEGGQVAHITVPLPGEDCLASGEGRFTGGGFQLRVGDARITRGLTVHCDLVLSNNLEVNWGGNKFHMLEHLETVECSDSPEIVQAPPAAPLDTMIGVGEGRYNGELGYTIEFTFVDYGEPGSSDRAALKIYETANPGNVVLDVPLQLLSGGNLQAHYDQPHK